MDAWLLGAASEVVQQGLSVRRTRSVRHVLGKHLIQPAVVVEVATLVDDVVMGTVVAEVVPPVAEVVPEDETDDAG